MQFEEFNKQTEKEYKIEPAKLGINKEHGRVTVNQKATALLGTKADR
jgi:hypothetical protein